MGAATSRESGRGRMCGPWAALSAVLTRDTNLYHIQHTI